MDPIWLPIWLSALSLLVALLGGVPGLLSIVSHFKNRPRLYLQVTHTVVGQVSSTENPERRTMLLLSVTLANEGTQPLCPASFDVEWEAAGRWIKLTKLLIPSDVRLSSDEQRIEIDRPWERDLQKPLGGVMHGQPHHGFLLFFTDAISLQRARQMFLEGLHLKITMTDIFGKRHVREHRGKPGGLGEMGSKIAFPHQGMTVTRLPSVDPEKPCACGSGKPFGRCHGLEA